MSAPQPFQNILIMAALIRQGDSILMVEQQGLGDTVPSWSLPGGVVEPGERLDLALRREVSEETGLEVTRIGALQYLVEFDEPAAGRSSLALVLEVEAWRGDLLPADPDGLILQACFVPVDKAIHRLQSIAWLSMSEPLIACLSGQARPGTLWLYSTAPDGSEVACQA